MQSIYHLHRHYLPSKLRRAQWFSKSVVFKVLSLVSTLKQKGPWSCSFTSIIFKVQFPFVSRPASSVRSLNSSVITALSSWKMYFSLSPSGNQLPLSVARESPSPCVKEQGMTTQESTRASTSRTTLAFQSADHAVRLVAGNTSGLC